MVHNFQEAHKQSLEKITQILVEITNLTSEQIKPYLNQMLENLVEPKKRPFYETATPEEWSVAFQEWVDSHQNLNLPFLDDEAISRESIYGDRG
ncbi:MAG: hypothetical protein H0X31_24010 [Nostocaceae cyanobacterium]|nr:hypothetical protein [Nostocaceae cyanobacterium]